MRFARLFRIHRGEGRRVALVVGVMFAAALTGTLGRLGPRRAYLGAPLVLAAAVLGRRLLLVSGAGWVYRLLWIIVTLAFLVQGIALWGTAGAVADTRQAKRLSRSSPPAASWAPWWAAW